MKHIATAFCVALLAATVPAKAQTATSLQSMLEDQVSAANFNKMFGDVTQPAWIANEAVTSPAMLAKISGQDYTVLYACQQNNCAAEQLAVLVSAKGDKMYGVLSSSNEENNTQSLTWLNMGGGDETIDGKTILFAALTGSLDNHPGAFDFK